MSSARARDLRRKRQVPGEQTIKDDKTENPNLLPKQTATATLTADFVKVEKNLASLGFFTPSSKRIRDAKAKTITFIKVIDGKKVEARATIAPAALYGLPITADQDKYLALQKIIMDFRLEQGIVTNPIAFTSADILRLLRRHRDSGKNYKEVEEWLKVMTATTIISEGTVYFTGRKTWAKDIFHVFDRSVLFGQELEPGGKVADKNYVWLSEWQLENINNNHLLPIDLEAYQQLKTHIAKVLVPLLQIWLYATREEGSFEKRYDELCQILNIRQYQHLSLIKQKFGPALNELKEHGYLEDWRIEETSDGKAFKIVFYHGEKFHRDRRNRLAQKEQITGVPEQSPQAKPTPSEPTEQGIDAAMLAEFTKRGIPERSVQKLIENQAPLQQIIDQLEWGDFLLNTAPPGKFYNPTGLYIHLIKANITPPDTFESSRQRRLREEAYRARANKETEKLHLEMAYSDYRRQEIDKYINANYDQDHYQELLRRKKEQLSKENPKQFSNWPDESLTHYAEMQIRQDLTPWVMLDTFETFCRRQNEQQPNLPFDGVGESPTPTTAPTPPTP